MARSKTNYFRIKHRHQDSSKRNQKSKDQEMFINESKELSLFVPKENAPESYDRK